MALTMDQWSGVEEPLNYVAFKIAAVCTGTCTTGPDWLPRGPETTATLSAQQSAFVDITIIFTHHQYLDC